MWTRYLTEPLRGKTPLWQVIWIYGFGASVIFALAQAIFAPRSRLGIGLYFAVGLVLGVLQSVMLWQCAYNSRHASYGHLLRFLVVLGALLTPLLLYFVWRHPELRDLLG